MRAFATTLIFFLFALPARAGDYGFGVDDNAAPSEHLHGHGPFRSADVARHIESFFRGDPPKGGQTDSNLSASLYNGRVGFASTPARRTVERSLAHAATMPKVANEEVLRQAVAVWTHTSLCDELAAQARRPQLSRTVVKRLRSFIGRCAVLAKRPA